MNGVSLLKLMEDYRATNRMYREANQCADEAKLRWGLKDLTEVGFLDHAVDGVKPMFFSR